MVETTSFSNIPIEEDLILDYKEKCKIQNDYFGDDITRWKKE